MLFSNPLLNISCVRVVNDIRTYFLNREHYHKLVNYKLTINKINMYFFIIISYNYIVVFSKISFPLEFNL